MRLAELALNNRHLMKGIVKMSRSNGTVEIDSDGSVLNQVRNAVTRNRQPSVTVYRIPSMCDSYSNYSTCGESPMYMVNGMALCTEHYHALLIEARFVKVGVV